MIGQAAYYEAFVERATSSASLLSLQNLFLNPGFHEVPVSTVDDGRDMVITMLNALSCYAAPYHLTLSKQTPNITTYSLLDELHAIAGDEPITLETIDQVLNEAFFADFCWIEETSALRAQPWYEMFMQRIHEYDFVSRIPFIVIVTP